ncbi:hypothetical protein [Halospeciosus flavus]|uniref:Uncharacterized protein n=1 Tax=Halospeciosus flavus TaxID=3032283 RepID=A0ABD5Z1V1_9EURY|nr:hypothetical protein [Halospeciosus flavus]
MRDRIPGPLWEAGRLLVVWFCLSALVAPFVFGVFALGFFPPDPMAFLAQFVVAGLVGAVVTALFESRGASVRRLAVYTLAVVGLSQLLSTVMSVGLVAVVRGVGGLPTALPTLVGDAVALVLALALLAVCYVLPYWLVYGDGREHVKSVVA